MAAQAESAIRRRDDVLASDEAREALDALRHELGVLDDRRRVRHDAGREDLSRGQLHALAERVLVLMASVRGFDKIALRLDGKHDVHDIGEPNASSERTMPATPADVIPDLLLREIGK